MKKIKVMLKTPDNTTKLVNIEDSLEELQRQVGGIIEYPYYKKLNKKNIAIIVNEEGKLIGLEPCIAFAYDNKIVDYVVGNVIFVGIEYGEECTENASLTDEQIEYIQNQLYSNLKCIIPSTGATLDVIEF
jgi:hypothetical protein